MALGTPPADQAGLVQVGNNPQLGKADATVVNQGPMSFPHGPHSALQPLGRTVPEDPQLIESVRQTGNKERNGNGGGYEGMGVVGHQHLTPILPLGNQFFSWAARGGQAKASLFITTILFPRLLPPLKGPPTQMSPDSPTLGEGAHPDWPGGSRYDLDEIDAYWLELLNSELKEMGR